MAIKFKDTREAVYTAVHMAGRDTEPFGEAIAYLKEHRVGSGNMFINLNEWNRTAIERRNDVAVAFANGIGGALMATYLGRNLLHPDTPHPLDSGRASDLLAELEMIGRIGGKLRNAIDDYWSMVASIRSVVMLAAVEKGIVSGEEAGNQ